MFIPISNVEKKYTIFGLNGGEIWKIIEIGVYIYMYIYSWSVRKKKTFSKNLSPSAKFVYTKTFVWKVYNGNRIDPNARRLTKIKPKEIFNNSAISREPFDEIDSNFFYFKDSIWVSISYKISWGIQKLTLFLFPKLAAV